MKHLAILIVLFLFAESASAQRSIKTASGYSNDIGNMIAMLDDLKSRVTWSVNGLSQAETDFLLDDQANRIGAIILHLAATEKNYQVLTFENRSYNKEETAQWEVAMSLGSPARERLTGKPISYYLDRWTEVRQKTKELLKTKDDAWFAENVNSTSMNNHWAWYHVMEHQANHMGQIRMIMSRFP